MLTKGASREMLIRNIGVVVFYLYIYYYRKKERESALVRVSLIITYV